MSPCHTFSTDFANDIFCTMNTFSIVLLCYKVFFNLQISVIIILLI